MTTIAPTPRERLDPELAMALDAIPKGPAGIFDFGDIAGTRRTLSEMAQAGQAAAEAETSVAIENMAASQSDAPSVPLRLFRPIDQSAPLPALLWFHGGGQVVGTASQEDLYIKTTCKRVGCLIASVDYRLAPENPSPAAAEDGFATYRWLLGEAERLGVDGTRIGIAGASGGGCIAAATVLMIRDRGVPLPLFQALNYPMLDDRNETPSSHEITDLGIFNRSANLLAWKAVLGDRAGTGAVSAYSAPAREPDLSGLPPTFIAVGELDVFRDEDVTFATRLIQAGVDVDLHLYAGAYHAWDVFAPESALAATFHDTWYGYLSRKFRA